MKILDSDVFIGVLMMTTGLTAFFFNKQKNPKEMVGDERVGYLKVQGFGYMMVIVGFLAVIIGLIRLLIDPNWPH